MNALPSQALLPVALAAAKAAASDVWEVGAGGLATISEAIDLAADGDIVLVHAGTYPGFTLVAKSLVIVAEAGESVTVDGTVAVHSLTAGQTATLQGLRIQGDAGDVAVRATLNDGALWIEDCTVEGAGGCDALQAVVCASVVLRRSSFAGGHGSLSYSGVVGSGGDGVILRESAASVFSCLVTGGLGSHGWDDDVDCHYQLGGSGGHGMDAENAVVLLEVSTLKGGNGGTGDTCDCCSPTYCGDGGPGGAGLRSFGQSEISLVLSTLTGGGGGYPGEFLCLPGADGLPLQLLGGRVVELPLVPPSLAASSPVREGQTAVAVASGEPFELLAVYASVGTALSTPPDVLGFQLLEPPLLLLGATVLPAGGVFQIQAPVPDLGPSAEGLPLRLQTVGLSTTSGFVLGEAATIVLLDAAL